MPWFKVDDSFYDHPKVFDAPDCAVALWVRAGSWAARNLTDGFVPSNMPARLCDDPETAVRELVDRRLWRRAKGGYQFHQWNDDGRQPTRVQVEAKRKVRAEAGRKGGLASGKTRSKREANDEANASGLLGESLNPRPVPSSPEGTRTDTGSQSSSRRNARATGPDDDDSIDLAAVQLLSELTGREVSITWAAKVRQRILGNRTVEHRMAYVVSAIRENPAKFAPPAEGVDPPPSLTIVPPLPPWCGFCHADDYRWIETPDGRWAKCRECNPDAAKEAS